ncbi:hypothetical protein [Oligosphaera ethanolica]|uniref:Uncharacterized protein n=1 Tax=Oligosphaera ethanolica TaxID=760260 RepID=A0AAE3VHA9_9BACT|nr:hypothetical protein [Oligosphaera ethanolica]MDQ0290587.1 hypothetical protein [Oligosphaera ethanolica]
MENTEAMLLNELPEEGRRSVSHAIEFFFLTRTSVIRQMKAEGRLTEANVKHLYLDIAAYLDDNFRHGGLGLDTDNGVQLNCYASSIILYLIFLRLFPAQQDLLRFIYLRQHLTFGIQFQEGMLYLDSVACYRDFSRHLNGFPGIRTGGEFTVDYYVCYFNIGRDQIREGVMLRPLSLNEFISLMRLTLSLGKRDLVAVRALQTHLVGFPIYHAQLAALLMATPNPNRTDIMSHLDTSIQLDSLDYYPRFLRFVMTREKSDGERMLAVLPNPQAGHLPLGLEPLIGWMNMNPPSSTVTEAIRTYLNHYISLGRGL